MSKFLLAIAVLLLSACAYSDPLQVAVPQQIPEQNLNPRLLEFQRQCAIAQAKRERAISDPATAEDRLVNRARPSLGIPIKCRQNRIPIVDVIFNGNRSFEMRIKNLLPFGRRL
jgi:hypothetical protein